MFCIHKIVTVNPMKKLKNTKIIKHIDSILEQLDKDFGKWKCRSMVLGCGACEAEMLRVYLDWYRDLYE